MMKRLPYSLLTGTLVSRSTLKLAHGALHWNSQMSAERILRHPNGGARKIGTEVHVSPDSFCDHTTEIGGDSAILQCTLKDSVVINSKLFDTAAETVWLNGSICSRSSLQGVFASECILDRVVASNHGSGVLLLRNVVAETCELHGSWRLEGNARIPEGVWHRAPRFARITGENGVDFGLTESLPGYGMLGCWKKPLTELLKAGPRLGRKHGWTEEQIHQARLFYEELADIKMEGVHA